MAQRCLHWLQLICLLTVGVAGGLNKRACHERTANWTRDVARIPLSCQDTEWIHVKAERVAVRGSQQDCSNGFCNLERRDDNTGLGPVCSRESNCEEPVDLGGLAACNNDEPTDYAEVSYECITESGILQDVCTGSTVSVSGQERVYLFTTRKGEDTFSPGVNKLCRCRVSTSGPDPVVVVEALELYFGEGVGMNVTENCQDVVSWSIPQRFGRLLTNTRVGSIRCSSANITFHDHGIAPRLAWFQFTASENSRLSISCGDSVDPTPASPASPAGSGSTSTSAPEKKPATDRGDTFTSDGPDITVVVIGGVLAAAVVVLVIVVVIVLRKRRRSSPVLQNAEAHPEKGDNCDTNQKTALLPDQSGVKTPADGAHGGRRKGDSVDLNTQNEQTSCSDREVQDALVDNILYESTRETEATQSTRRPGDSTDKNLPFTDDVPPTRDCDDRQGVREEEGNFMVDNVLYESSSTAPESAPSCLGVKGQNVIDGVGHQSPSAGKPDDRDFMVDNILYESSQQEPKELTHDAGHYEVV